MTFYFNLSPTLNLYSLEGDSNSRFVVDGDYNGKFRLESRLELGLTPPNVYEIEYSFRRCKVQLVTRYNNIHHHKGYSILYTISCPAINLFSNVGH